LTEYRPRKAGIPNAAEKVTENGSEVTEKVTETQIGVMEATQSRGSGFGSRPVFSTMC